MRNGNEAVGRQQTQPMKQTNGLIIFSLVELGRRLARKLAVNKASTHRFCGKQL